jgi:hypothetical protein
MIKRRAKAAALPYSTCCHTFRATGITTYMQNGGTLEHAQQIAAHESPRTTKLYDRTQDEIARRSRTHQNLMAAKRRRHHEIQEYYLRGFCELGTSFVWIFDRNRPFSPGGKYGVNNPCRRGVGVTALRSDEYAARTRAGKKDYLYELELNKQEQPATEVMRKIAAFGEIGAADKCILAAYIFLTLKRVTRRDDEMRQKVREALAKMTAERRNEVLRQAAAGQFASANQLQKELGYWESEDAETVLLRESMIGQVGLVHQALMAKAWQFVRAAPEDFFVTSDNPVVFDRSLGLRLATLLFPLTQNVVLVADGSGGEDLVYRDSSPDETRKVNSMIIMSAEREVYSPRADESIHRGLTDGFSFYS